jgi:methylthioribose-1-phosphate isomerase
MKVDGKDMRPIWLDGDQVTVKVIDQRKLPHQLVIADLTTVDEVIEAIQKMYVRGAPLIGVTGAYGVLVAVLREAEKGNRSEIIEKECQRLKSARPTAVNLVWGVERTLTKVLKQDSAADRIQAARQEAGIIAEEEVDNCRRIGEHGCNLIADAAKTDNKKTVNILTHCNAGWLACIEYGTATAPIYTAFDKGIDVHVWVDETRPLNQGSRLTAWELGKHGVPHTIITDNAGGHLMQHGLVDMVIVGTDRTTHTGDVANKIGTYLKALAARDNGIPLYVALPSSTFDWQLTNGINQIPIEERDPDEIRYVQGSHAGEFFQVLVPPASSPVANHAFDVTPARLVSAFITERGICGASREEIRRLFPDKG